MIKDGINKVEHDIVSFLMIGQSNMAGRGDLDDVPVIANKNLYMLRMGRWQILSEPVNTDRAITKGDFHSGVSLGASFGDEHQKHFNIKTGMIPCADGGTSMSQWMPGEILFDHAVFMTKLAMRTSNFGGILWHQGESDCNKANIGLYKERFITMINEMCRQLDVKDIPIIIGELSTDTDPTRWGHGAYVDQMNEVFVDISKTIPNCAVASAKGLTIKPDGLHFDAKGCREFGKRYFQKYLELVK